MSKKKEVAEVTTPEQVTYFRLVRNTRNMFSVESIILENNIVVKTETTEETYLPIAFDQLRRKTAESFFDAVRENSK